MNRLKYLLTLKPENRDWSENLATDARDVNKKSMGNRDVQIDFLPLHFSRIPALFIVNSL